MPETSLAFPHPVIADGVPGFPREIARLDEARAVIEATRLPLARSQYRWLDAYNRLTRAQATGSLGDVEAARCALNLAVASERAEARTVALGLAA